MSLQVGRRYGRTTGPVLWGQNEKTPPPDSPRANEMSDVFVVGGQPPLVTCGDYLARFVPTLEIESLPSRASPLPHGYLVSTKPVGAGLPAMGPHQAIQCFSQAVRSWQ